LLAAEVVRLSYAPVVRIERVKPLGPPIHRAVAYPIARSETVCSGHSRTRKIAR